MENIKIISDSLFIEIDANCDSVISRKELLS